MVEPRRVRPLRPLALVLVVALWPTVANVGSFVAPAPAPSAWPDATNTGPLGVTLTPSGSITTTYDGQVIDGLDVRGSINVQHNNVVIRRTRVRNAGQAIIMNNDRRNLVIEDCELDGTGVGSGIQAVGDSNYTMRRCNIHHFGEGARASGSTILEDNWFHDFTSFISQGAHQDVVQITGGSNVVMRHNTMLMNVNGGNSAIMIGTSSGNNIRIENNLLAGGGYTIFGGYPSYTNVVIIDNKFSTRYYPRSGYYGPGASMEDAEVVHNSWYEAGAPMPSTLDH